MADSTVRYYDYTMAGAPALAGQAGKLLDVLDKCLIDGFGSVTLSSLSVSSGVATATVSTGHGFFLVGGLLGPVIRIAGATPSGLNGDWRIASIPSTTQFTFACPGVSDSAPSGTITAKIAPLGWTKPFSGTNKAVYARSAAGATAMVLRIDDTGTTSATAIMYESMIGIDTGTGPAPTSGSVYVGKSTSADGVARRWRLIADPFVLYLFCDRDNSTWGGGIAFGDICSDLASDAYHCMICAGQSDNQLLYLSDTAGVVNNRYLSRPYTQLGSPVQCGHYSHRRFDLAGYITGRIGMCPSPVDGKIHIYPIEAWDSTTWPRGRLAGLYSPLSVLDDGVVIPGINGNPLLFQQIVSTDRRFAIDLVGPWR